MHGSKGANPTDLLHDLEEIRGGAIDQADEDTLCVSQDSRSMLEQYSEAYKSVKLATRCTTARRRQFLTDHKAIITAIRDWVLLYTSLKAPKSTSLGNYYKRDLTDFLTGKECPPTNTKQSGGDPKAHPTRWTI